MTASQCATCTHPDRAAIDDALRGGQTRTAVAAAWALSRSSVGRHAARHLRPLAAAASGIGADGTWQPAFPGQRPPFEPGHTLTLHHGAHSPRHVDPVAAEHAAAVLSDPATAFLAAPAWRPAVWAWARAEAQVELLTAYLAGRAEETGDGVGDLADERVLAAYALLHRAESRASVGRSRLGLDPLSAARLGRDRVATQVDMARVMAELDRQDRPPPPALSAGSAGGGSADAVGGGR